MESIAEVDLRLLSQAEISALAASSSPSNPHSFPLSDDPKIDRSTFNESAGGRKQTYSRLRSLSSPRRRGRPPRALPPSASSPSNLDDNRRILLVLRRLFLQNGLHHVLLPEPDPKPRRGGRPPKRPCHPASSLPPADPCDDAEAVTARGSRVDLAGLAEKGDAEYTAEIARRTAGRDNEDGLLAFLGELEGKWATARKRRRIVDAAGFGDALPRGWKLLLALKRKEGKIWVHCRRFISPSGKDFLTCKEASTYMLSIVGPDAVASFPNGTQSEDTAMAVEMTSACPQTAGPTEHDNSNIEAPVSSSGCPGELANTSNTQSINLLACRKCTLTFSDKNRHDQHFLTFHPSTKRSSLGNSIASGVIIKDGKYECQFCHKIFTEKRRYNGHVGVHARLHFEAHEASTCMMPDEQSLQSPLSSSRKQDEQISPATVEALPCVDQPELAAQSPIKDLSLLPSEKQDDQSHSESVEALQFGNHCESVPEPSLDELPSSSYDIKDEVGDNSADRIHSDLCHMNADIPKTNGLAINEDDSFHLTTLSNSTFDTSGSKHTDIHLNTDDQELRSNSSHCTPVDIDISSNANDGSEKRTDFLTVDKRPNTDLVFSNSHNTGEYCDDIKGDEHQPAGNQNDGSVDPSVGDSQMNVQTDIICDEIDRNREADIPTSMQYEGSMHLWVDHYNSPEEHFQANESSISINADEGSLDVAGGSVASSKAKSVDDVADNMIGEILGNSSEINNIHVFEDVYNKTFVMQCSSDTKDSSVHISAIGQVGCFSEINKKMKNALKSSDGGFSSHSSDCTLMNAHEIVADVPIGNVDSAQTNKKLSTEVHSSVNSQTTSAYGVARSYMEKDVSVNTVDQNRNYQNDFKFNSESNVNNFASIWQQSTEGGGLFANRTTSGLENSICDQQFYLEENLQTLPSGGPSYNIQTDRNNILSNVVEEQRVASVDSYTRPESGFLVGQRLSSGNTLGNKFIHNSSRPETSEKDTLLIPHSTGQNFDISSHGNSLFPFDVQDSFMCQTRSPGTNYEGSLGCGYGGSSKIPVGDNSGVGGAELLRGSAARPLPQWIQSPNYFSSTPVLPNQEKGNRYYSHQQRECSSGFESINADGYGHPVSGLMANQDSRMRSAHPMNFDYNGGNVFAQPFQLDWNMSVPQMNTRHQVTTCMWCRANFTQSGNIQVQPDSIGFICPNCKAKISGQLKF